MRSSAACAFGNCDAGGGEAQARSENERAVTPKPRRKSASFVRRAPAMVSFFSATQRVQQIEIRVGQREPRREQADLVFLTQLGEARAVDHGHGAGAGRRCFFTRAAQHLTSGDDQTRESRPVVMQSSAKLRDPLATDLAAIATYHDCRPQITGRSARLAREVKLSAVQAGPPNL